MKIILLETSNAHLHVPERAWLEVKVYPSLKSAYQALSQHLTKMHEICGPRSWSHNHSLRYWESGKSISDLRRVDEETLAQLENYNFYQMREVYSPRSF